MASIEKDFDTVLVLDFGAQYSQLIARRVREQNVFCKIVPYYEPLESIQAYKPRALIFSGSPASVYDAQAPMPDTRIYSLGIPILGICYGMQCLVYQQGGTVERGVKREYGKAVLTVLDDTTLFRGLDNTLTVWMSHGDKVTQVPPGFRRMAESGNALYAAVCHDERQLYGVQFHPEVMHTPHGKEMLARFLFDISHCQPNWTMHSFIETAIDALRTRIGSGRVVLGLSGGVDSSVAAVLLHTAIKDQLQCIFVNNGVLRKNEPQKVIETFQHHFGMNLRYVDASDIFLSHLKGVTDPEEKRKIIGREFIRAFEREARMLGPVSFLAQGTLYPDVIESVSVAGGPSATIKSHHNVGGLPPDMRFELIEPLRDLFKDEVRLVGAELGLPEDILYRHPFPGPGLAVRILGEITEERLQIVREADAIVLEEIKKAALYQHIWQAFAVLLPVKTVGVMGDGRTYAHVVAVRAVHSTDGMTADWVRLPYDVLDDIARRIINEVEGVNRVVYDISSKPPSTIEWE